MISIQYNMAIYEYVCSLYLPIHNVHHIFTYTQRADWKAKRIPCHDVMSFHLSWNLCFHFVQKTDNDSDL